MVSDIQWNCYLMSPYKNHDNKISICTYGMKNMDLKNLGIILKRIKLCMKWDKIIKIVLNCSSLLDLSMRMFWFRCLIDLVWSWHDWNPIPANKVDKTQSVWWTALGSIPLFADGYKWSPGVNQFDWDRDKVSTSDKQHC